MLFITSICLEPDLTLLGIYEASPGVSGDDSEVSRHTSKTLSRWLKRDSNQFYKRIKIIQRFYQNFLLFSGFPLQNCELSIFHNFHRSRFFISFLGLFHLTSSILPLFSTFHFNFSLCCLFFYPKLRFYPKNRNFPLNEDPKEGDIFFGFHSFPRNFHTNLGKTSLTFTFLS